MIFIIFWNIPKRRGIFQILNLNLVLYSLSSYERFYHQARYYLSLLFENVDEFFQFHFYCCFLYRYSIEHY